MEELIDRVELLKRIILQRGIYGLSTDDIIGHIKEMGVVEESTTELEEEIEELQEEIEAANSKIEELQEQFGEDT